MPANAYSGAGWRPNIGMMAHTRGNDAPISRNAPKAEQSPKSRMSVPISSVTDTAARRCPLDEEHYEGL